MVLATDSWVDGSNTLNYSICFTLEKKKKKKKVKIDFMLQTF